MREFRTHSEAGGGYHLGRFDAWQFMSTSVALNSVAAARATVCFTRKPSCTRAYVLKGQSDSSICHLQFWRRSSSSLRLAPSIMRNAKSGVPAQSSVTVVLENFMFSPKTRLSSLPPRSHQSERQKRGTKPKRRMGQVPPWLPTQMSAKNKTECALWLNTIPTMRPT